MTTQPATIAISPYVTAHVHSSKHRVEVEASDHCGCFFCFRVFKPATIKSWIDANQTALCPHCGIDSVVGSAYGKINNQFLRGMHAHHFAFRSR